MSNWTQIRVACKTRDIDNVSAVMSMLDSGLMIEDANEIDKLDTIYGELLGEDLITADRTRGAVSIYVPEEKNAADYTAFIKERLESLEISYELTLSGMKEEDWADSWKQYYKPVRIGKRLIVVPTWETYEALDDDIVLLMDPGMAFGTGTHETTRLCSEIMERYMPENAKVLDVGTGSGILAVAASKLGASEIDAYDIDPVAVRIAKENAAVNNCKNINCGISDLLAGVDKTGGLYDFVCANIVADIIVRMSPDISAYMKPGALLAVSGIINTQEERVKTALTDGGLTLVVTESENDWKAMLFRKQ